MTPRRRLAELVAGAHAADPAAADRPLVDIGSSVVTGIRDRRARLPTAPPDVIGHPVAQTRVLTAAGAVAVGSDCVRAGVVYPRPELDAADTFLDPLGVRWLWADGEPTPLEHPLADDHGAAGPPAVPWEIAGPAAGTELIVVADAPVAGLVEHCSALRGQWQFLSDVAEDRPRASALLDRALAAAVEGYERLLHGLPESPDVVLLRDELGFAESMFLAEADFHGLVAPRLAALVTHLRGLGPSSIALAVTGAVAPLLPALARLEVELLNVDPHARGMDAAQLRRGLPAATVLHGVTDVVALGRAVAVRDLAVVANELYQFARCWPVVIAPAGSIALAELPDAMCGATFLSALTGADVALVRQAGPVRSIVDRCLAAVVAADLDGVPAALSAP